MSTLVIPQGYKAPLPNYELQRAIAFIKESFQTNLSNALNLRRVSAPLFVTSDSGLNDNLNGTERPVRFDIPGVGGKDAEVVHSLAKWKRLALKRYGFHEGKGLYTDMNAIRRDEDDLDNIHSVYVDQWDWEKIISREDRNEAYLKATVRAIVAAVCETSEALNVAFPSLRVKLDREVYFVTTQELEDRWPDKTPKEREHAICAEHHTVFLMQIGGKLRSGEKHDGRAPDYDDWALNGDILMWNPILERSFEISSMGIRVDEESMARQLKLAGCEERAELPFHKMLLNGELPQTIGGGIGQSRLCMLMIGNCHIGEVQASIWDAETMKQCEEAGIILLKIRRTSPAAKMPRDCLLSSFQNEPPSPREAETGVFAYSSAAMSAAIRSARSSSFRYCSSFTAERMVMGGAICSMPFISSRCLAMSRAAAGPQLPFSMRATVRFWSAWAFSSSSSVSMGV